MFIRGKFAEDSAEVSAMPIVCLVGAVMSWSAFPPQMRATVTAADGMRARLRMAEGHAEGGPPQIDWQDA